MSIPYTYLIGWSKFDKWYYGVRYARDCTPNDLWKKYFTSSDVVQKFREQYGEPDIIEVRKTFHDADSARLWEENILKRLKVKSSDRWLNKNDVHAPPILWGHTYNRGRKQSIETLEKRSQSMKNTMAKKFPVENRNNPVEFGSEEHRALLSEQSKKLWRSRTEDEVAEIGRKISEKNLGNKNRLGHTNSIEHRARASESIRKVLSEDQTKTTAGKLWWNNGEINRRSIEAPGTGWIRGKLIKNKKSYNSDKMKQIWALRKAGKLPMPSYG